MTSGMSVTSTVDALWARIFAMEPAVLRAPGVRVVADAPGLGGYQGLWLLRLGEGCTIGAPEHLADEVRDRVRPRTADDVFTPETARELAGEHAGLVFGPSIHAYLDSSTLVRPGPCDARRLGDEAERVLEPLRSAMDPDEWAEGGFDHDGELWAAFEEGRIVAAGNMTDFFGSECDDVGLATHPDHRGRGLGTRLAGAMIEAVLPSRPVVRYRALATNLASRAVCRKLGFADDGANIAVRPRST